MFLLKGFDLVVATRMHVMIMALCVGTPVLPIAYEFKTKELANRLKLEGFVSDINTINREDLIGKAEALIGTLDRIHPRTMKAVIGEYESAMSVVNLLKDLKVARERDHGNAHTGEHQKPWEAIQAVAARSGA